MTNRIEFKSAGAKRQTYAQEYCWHVEIENDGRFVRWMTFNRMSDAIQCADDFEGRRNARVLKIGPNGERPV
jgi:hypothetical protein